MNNDMGMNYQCRQCKPIRYIPDDGAVHFGGYVVCKSCAETMSKADMVKSIIGVSYAHDEQMKAVAIVAELEAENKRLKNLINSILIEVKMSHDSDVVSLATTLLEFYEKHDV